MSGYNETRNNVRNNFISLLTDQTAAGKNVFKERAVPLFDKEVSCINIYILSDTPVRDMKIDSNYDRTLSIALEVLVRKTAAIEFPETIADQIVGAIEDRILPNTFLQYPPPNNIQLPGGEGDPGEEILSNIDVVEETFNKTPEGLNDVYGVIMELTGQYHYNKKQGAAVPFVTANIHYDLEGKQAVVDQAEDKFTLPQP